VAERPDAPALRARLASLLGGYAPARPDLLRRTPIVTRFPGLQAERLDLRLADGGSARAILTGPQGARRGLPAVLYCHAHGNRYGIGASELLEGRPALLDEPYGPALARSGIVALCLDMPCFGERATSSESALSKAMLWQGRTLFGAMLGELGGALDLLSTLDEVDATRITAFGFSMGATHAFWLGALEPRLRAVAHACAFADLETLIGTGAHDLHGPYMTVPGLCPAFRTGEIAGLIAPRRQLALMGEDDPLTPPAAVTLAVADLERCYAGAPPGALSIHVGAGTGHKETPAMRAAVLDFLARA
jgi:dienelactone hydrolase